MTCQWIYLSHFLGADTPFYGGEDRFHIEPMKSMEKGDSCNACRWSFPNHAGTHIDLPRHFVHAGASLNDYSADFWIFKKIAFVDISDLDAGIMIGPEQLKLKDIQPGIELLLLKTGIEKLRDSSRYWSHGPVFNQELADYFRSNYPELRAFGFDTISISSWTNRQAGREAHRSFLGGTSPILLIEDMKLSGVNSTTLFSQVIVSPLLVQSADAAPCTIIGEVIQ